MKLLGRENGEDGFIVAARRISDLVNKALDNLNKVNSDNIKYEIEAVVSYLIELNKKYTQC